MIYPIIIVVAWLAANGNVDAQANGVAVDVEHCKATAAQSIATQAQDPNSPVKGDRAIVLCYDTRADAAKYAPPAPSKPVRKPGSVDL